MIGLFKKKCIAGLSVLTILLLAPALSACGEEEAENPEIVDISELNGEQDQTSEASGEDEQTVSSEETEPEETQTEEVVEPTKEELYAAAILELSDIGDTLGYSIQGTDGFNQVMDRQMPIVSLWVDYEEFRGENGIWYTAIDNRFEKKERIAAYSQFFSSTGELICASFNELCMHGTGSLANQNKGMRLYFDETYGTEYTVNNPKKLRYALFGEDYTNVNGETIDTFKTLVLRAGGNDSNYCMMRDMVIHRICRDMACDTQAGQPAVLFINGSIFCTYNIRERYDKHYLASHYDVDKNDVVILETPYPVTYKSDGTAVWVNDRDYEVDEGEEGDETAFNDLVDYAKSHDLRNEEYYAYVQERVDFDSLIDMCCAQLFFCNCDWPNNNIRVWQYTGVEDLSYVDRKWHFMLCDLDLGMGNPDNPMSYVSNTMYKVYSSNTKLTYLMKALLKNDEFRQKFIDRYQELINTTFSAENTTALWDEATADVEWAMVLNVSLRYVPSSYEKWETYVANARAFLEKRPAYAQQSLDDFKTNYETYLWPE